MQLFTKKEISNIILHVIFLATFLAIFFFTYTAKIEEEIITNQVKLLIDTIFDKTKFTTDEYKSNIRSKLDKLKPPDLSEEDKKVKEQNNNVMINSVKVMSGFIIGALFLSYIIFQSDMDLNKGTFVDLLKENCILLIFIMATEFAFLHLVAKNYVYADVNFVMREIILSIDKQMNKN